MQILGRLLRGFVYSHVTSRAISVSDNIYSEAASSAQALGLSLEKVLKIRSDAWKGIFLCSHEQYGDCVFKFVSSYSPSNGHHAHVGSMGLVRQASQELFPDVYLIGENYTVEDFVPGTLLSEMSGGEIDTLDLEDLFHRVREFGELCVSPTKMTRQECELIIYKHLNKLTYSYFSDTRISTLTSLLRHYTRIGPLVSDVGREFDRAVIPRGYVVGDLSPQNVILSTGGSKPTLRIIDVEHVGSGFWGFDQIWFLVTLTRHDISLDTLVRMYRYVVSSDAIAKLNAGAFMKSVTVLLLEANALFAGKKEIVRRSKALLHWIQEEGAI